MAMPEPRAAVTDLHLCYFSETRERGSVQLEVMQPHLMYQHVAVVGGSSCTMWLMVVKLLTIDAEIVDGPFSMF